MTKTEAAQFLNISVRSLERYTSQKSVKPLPKKGKAGALEYSDSELQRFKAELEGSPDATESPTFATSSPLSPDAPSLANTATLANLPRSSGAIVQVSEVTAQRTRPVVDAVQASVKLLLTLAEAQALTGLSRSTLRAAIDAGKLKARQIGRAWRIKRADLEIYIEGL
jgi:excisionase family DNA binding protein